MKKIDIIAFIPILLVILAFAICTPFQEAYKIATSTHPYIMAFFKFAILATLGEMVALRLRTGKYNQKNYGLLPRSIVWGILGIMIAAAMKLFASGVPQMLESFGLQGATTAMIDSISPLKFIDALFISTIMNCIFGPIFMTFHKITDTHIMNHEGRLSSLFCPIPIGNILANLNWDVQWNFVFKTTIPLFWIPAHTITFLLPGNIQVLFAASLSIVLGIILSMAAFLSREKAI